MTFLFQSWQKKFDKLNERRIDLINKKFRCGLTEEEASELAELSKKTSEMLNKKYPLPWKKLRKLERRLRKQGEKTLKMVDKVLGKDSDDAQENNGKSEKDDA